MKRSAGEVLAKRLSTGLAGEGWVGGGAGGALHPFLDVLQPCQNSLDSWESVFKNWPNDLCIFTAVASAVCAVSQFPQEFCCHTLAFCLAASFLSFENTLLKRNYFPRRFSEGNWHLLKCTRCVQSKEHWQQHLSLPCLLHHTKLSCHPVMSCCKPKLCPRSSFFVGKSCMRRGRCSLKEFTTENASVVTQQQAYFVSTTQPVSPTYNFQFPLSFYVGLFSLCPIYSLNPSPHFCEF